MATLGIKFELLTYKLYSHPYFLQCHPPLVHKLDFLFPPLENKQILFSYLYLIF